MKVTQTDYEFLKGAVDKVLQQPNCPTLDDYRGQGLSDVRYAWDMFWQTGIRIGDGVGVCGDIDLYAYCNSEHITTALLKIVGGKR